MTFHLKFGLQYTRNAFRELFFSCLLRCALLYSHELYIYYCHTAAVGSTVALIDIYLGRSLLLWLYFIFVALLLVRTSIY